MGTVSVWGDAKVGVVVKVAHSVNILNATKLYI